MKSLERIISHASEQMLRDEQGPPFNGLSRYIMCKQSWKIVRESPGFF